MAQHRAELASHNLDVATISFGPRQWLGVWLQETQSPFPLLLDEGRIAYHAFGLQRSFRQAWGPRNLAYYARAVWQGRSLYGNRGDTQQLGGDFLVDGQGVLRWVYPGRDPTSRPGIPQILSAWNNSG